MHQLAPAPGEPDSAARKGTVIRILFDGRWIGKSGIGRYSSELLRELLTIDDFNFSVIGNPSALPEIEERFGSDVKVVETDAEVYSLAEQVQLVKTLASIPHDLAHFPNFNVPLAYRGQFVSTIHDLTLLRYRNSDDTTIARLKYFFRQSAMNRVMTSTTRRAAAILTPTKYVAADVAQKFGIAGKIHVTGEGVAGDWASPAHTRYSSLCNFILYVGNFYPYKNVDRAISGFVSSDFYRAGGKFVLVGSDGCFRQDIIQRWAWLGDALLFTGHISDTELRSLYDQAAALIFPSLSEGFGLPGLEAMSVGLPVLSSRATCLPEVYADAALYFDPLNTQSISDSIDACWKDPSTRTRLINSGYVRLQEFSWKAAAHATADAYRNAVLTSA